MHKYTEDGERNICTSSGVMSQNIWGGTIIARERSYQARGSVATERGEGVGGECPPSHGRELFHFSTWKCAIWGIPKKEILTWQHVLYGYACHDSTDREKCIFFHEFGNIIMKIIYAPQYNLRKISNTCQSYTQT